MTSPWKDSIYLQREQLALLLQEPLARLATQCAPAWGSRERLNTVLLEGYPGIPHCTFLYCLGFDGIQICDNIGDDGGKPALIPGHFGRDRSQRPYMNEAVPAWGFLLSDAYISLLKRRPSLTALQIVRNAEGTALGYLGADFDLRNLPATPVLYEESGHWRQIKGDPAIRSAVFQQTRNESAMDRTLDTVVGVMEELMTDRGVFHGKLHFSSSRATVWLYDDPYRYRLLDIDALTDPDTCLIYPVQPYPQDAVVPREKIRPILDAIAALRFIDDTFYLRAGSLNIMNGMVGLTFSCDGSHYLPWDEFLTKGREFWASGVTAG
jgi:hypothetical protein